MKLES
jgi:NIMA (never in mitosis gene a)-related kinase